MTGGNLLEYTGHVLGVLESPAQQTHAKPHAGGDGDPVQFALVPVATRRIRAVITRRPLFGNLDKTMSH